MTLHPGPGQRLTPSPRSSAKLVLAAALMVGLVACRDDSPRRFRQPEQAIEALSSALAKGDDWSEMETLFGPGSLELVQSGDPVADRQDADHVLELIGEGVTWTDLDENTKVASFGTEPWPFPFPLVSDDGRWRFDLDTGAEELHSRRIGRNEIATLATMHHYVDAQREYWRMRPMGDPPVFARYFGSTVGTRDGLYWPTAEGEEMSPLGELVAQAEEEGYSPPRSREPAADGAAGEAPGEGADGAAGEAAGEAAPQEQGNAYHGYFFRILTAQGEHASGGARSYLDDEGRLRTGFAAVAWPASYDNSGIMTFLVNQFGIVFQKDLGADTATVAQAIEVFDPDQTWTPTGD